MRKFVVVLFFVTFLKGVFASDTLMLVGKTPVSISEFEYVYKKNNAENVKTIDEYLTLYENFKLKVVEAESRGLDKTETFRQELLGYREQLKGTYLTDMQKFNSFVEEAYQRSLEDIDVSHILFQIPQDATTDDTLQAYSRALQAKKRLETESFETVAREMSDDVSVSRNGGRLGYITSMMTIYPFETAVYNMSVGVVSNPIRTQIGYHIIYVHNRRPAVGEIRVRHILKTINQRMSESAKKQVKQEVDSLVALLQQGFDFEELAKTTSDDKYSAVNGGDLSWFGLGRMVPEFERAAFALKNVGDISEPILSPFGWHIIKLEEKRVLTKEAKKKKIESRLQRDFRMLDVKKSFVEKLKNDYAFKLNQVAVDDLNKMLMECETDSILRVKSSLLNDVLFLFAEEKVSQKDFVLQNITFPNKHLFQELLQDYIATRLINYEDSRLEDKYSDFRNLMREYREGMLLFELSKHEVWDKAANDTLGLENYFAKNRDKYKYETPLFKGYIIACRDKKVAKQIQKIVKNANPDSISSYINRRINLDAIPLVKLEKGVWEKGVNSVVDCLAFEKKKQMIEDKKAEYPFVFLKGELQEFPERYQDVRGLIISDYQEYIEKEWVKRLREKYPIQIFEDVKKTLH